MRRTLFIACLLWPTLAFGQAGQLPANTAWGNPTSARAAPKAMALPSCSGGSNALLWTSGVGFSCSSSVGPGGTASGDLSGSYPGPTVAKINGASLGTTTATSGNILIGSGTQWVTNSVSGDCAMTNAGVMTCTKTGGVAFGSAATVNVPLSLANGGLGGTQAAATANQIPVYPGSSGAAVPTSASSWFDNVYCNTVGFIIVRTTGAWTCSAGIMASVTWFGAVGDGVTDNTTAIQNTINAVQTHGSGGMVFFPPTNGGTSTYCVFSGVSVAGAASVRMIGAAETVGLATCNHDTTVVTLNVANSSIEYLSIYGKGANGDTTFNATQSALVIGSSCISCELHHMTIVGGLHGISTTAGEFHSEFIDVTDAYGSALIYIRGGGWFLRNKFDQQWPQSQPPAGTTISAWTNAHAYNLGDVVSTAGFVIQATQAGTSGGVAPTLKNYNQTITDNTVHWLLVSPTTYASVQVDTGASEVQMIQTDLTGAFTYGLQISNTLAGTAPVGVIFTDGVIGQNYSDAILGTAGSNLTVKGSRVGGCLQASCATINFQTTFSGDVVIVGNTIAGGADGILVNGGKNYNITGNNVFGTTAVGIQIGCATTAITDFVINGNIIGSSTFWGANNAALTLTAGACDFYNIIGNITHGSSSGITDGGTGANKSVTLNH